MEGKKYTCNNCFSASCYDLCVTDFFFMHLYNFLALQMSLFHFLFIKLDGKELIISLLLIFKYVL